MIDSELNGDTTEPAQTVPCSLCSRKFLAERLEKHQKICSKTKESQKKRKIFDSHKQRADLETVNGFPITPPSRLTTATKEETKPNKTSNWRAKHEEFIRTVRQARGEKVDEPATNGDAVSSRVPVGYIMCQFCSRNFSDKAADRHIQWCKEQKARVPRSATNSKALERMKARTQYKPANKSSPKTETPPKPIVSGSRSQPPTPPNNRRENVHQNGKPTTPTTPNGKPKPPNSLPLSQPNGLKSKVSPKTAVRKPISLRTTPSPPSKSRSDTKRINNLSRPKNMSPDSVEQLMKQTEPVMKFKEKFPNHTKSDTNFIKNEQLKELLKKTEAYLGGPRTVPGVRTGGMSPIKSDNHLYNHQNNGHYNSNHQISEDEDLVKLKSRIEELYLNGSTKFNPNLIQTNNNYNNNVNNGTNNRKNTFDLNSEGTTRGSTSGSSGAESSSSIHTPPRDNSASDGTRSQASSTTNSGLPKFCHQCGTKYPNTIAKYCYECGSRRLGTVGPFLSNLD